MFSPITRSMIYQSCGPTLALRALFYCSCRKFSGLDYTSCNFSILTRVVVIRLETYLAAALENCAPLLDGLGGCTGISGSLRLGRLILRRLASVTLLALLLTFAAIAAPQVSVAPPVY